MRSLPGEKFNPVDNPQPHSLLPPEDQAIPASHTLG